MTISTLKNPQVLTAGAAATYGHGRISALRSDFAVPTDGVTDATTGLQAWLAALTTSTVGVLPPGDYVHSGTLTIPANVTIHAAGATLISAGAVNNSVVLSNGSKLIGPLTVEDSRVYTAGNAHVGISGTAVSGFDLHHITVAGFGAFGILLSGCSDFSGSDIRVTGTGTADDGAGGWSGDGFWITGGCSDFRLANLDVSGNGRHGLFVWGNSGTSAENFVVSGVVANENGDCGVQLTAIKGFSLGNVVADHNGVNGGPYGGQGVQIVGSSGSPTVYGHGTLFGITATDNLENGVELHYVNDVTALGVTGLRNTWSGLAINNSQDVTSTAVTAVGNSTTGVSVYGSTDCVLTGVNAHNNSYDGVSVQNGSVRVILTSIRANNNGQGGGTRSGVVASASSDIVISDVQAFDTQGTATQDYGVRAYQVTGAEIRGVRGTGNSVRLVQVDGGTTGYTLNNPTDTGIYGGRWDSNGFRDLSGTGSPEGIVTASIGSVFHRTDGAASTTLYGKDSGAGNTGWQPYATTASVKALNLARDTLISSVTNGWQVLSGAPTIGNTSGWRTAGFDGVTQGSTVLAASIPPDWVTWEAYIWVYNVSGALNTVWRLDAVKLADAAALPAVPAASNVTVTPGDANVHRVKVRGTSVGGGTISGNGLFSLNLYRIAGDALDTSDVVANVLGLEFVRLT